MLDLNIYQLWHIVENLFVKSLTPKVRAEKSAEVRLRAIGYLEAELDYSVMNCISPVWIRSVKGFVPCGKCNFCLASRRADWSFRLAQECKVSKSAYFLTMTYDDVAVPWTDNGQSLCKRDVQLFTKRLREVNRNLLAGFGWPSVRYFSVGEYGSNTVRPHYHSIMFNLYPLCVEKVTEVWGKGHCKIGTVTPASIHYVTKYVINRVGEWDGRVAPFSLISQGLGKEYINSNRDWHKGDVLRPYVMQDGFKLRMPRYMKDRIFSVREKERMGKELLEAMDESKRKELISLAKYHPDPYGYAYERLVQAYNRVNEDELNLNAL